MYIRGSGSGQEYRREDQTPFRGVVVKNNDPLGMNRVKVYIPELSNQPFDEWFEKYGAINLKFPGKNNKTDNWVDTKIFDEIASRIPWAELMFPVMGESSPGRYYAEGEIATLSDCNYVEGFRVNDTNTPTLTGGTFSPAFLYENDSTVLGDGFNTPLGNFSIKCNPYSFNYRPSKHVNKTKGVISIPSVGSQVWVFHDDGDLNYPIVIGVSQNFRALTLMNDADNKTGISSTYSGDFENQ